METIIRIQDNEGRGIYRGNSFKHAWDELNNRDRHPGPQRDSLLVHNAPFLFSRSFDFISFNASIFVFGFSTIEQARSWIYQDKTLWKLHFAGFMVHVMEGEIYKGYTQAVINQKTAKTIEKQSIIKFFGLAKKK